MSEPRQNSKNKSGANSATAANLAVVWAVRVAVAVVAVVALSLAWQEFQVKQAFSSTNEAWQSALRSKGENADLTKSEFSKIPVTGSPTVTTGKAGPNSFAAVNVDTFTWSGRLRSYTVKVYFGLGNDPPVEQIEVVESGNVTAQ